MPKYMICLNDATDANMDDPNGVSTRDPVPNDCSFDLEFEAPNDEWAHDRAYSLLFFADWTAMDTCTILYKWIEGKNGSPSQWCGVDCNR